MTRRIARTELSSSVSEAVRRLNPELFGEAAKNGQKHTPLRENAGNGIITHSGVESLKNGIKTGISGNSGAGTVRQKAMNKTERRAEQYLKFIGFCNLIAQPTRLFPLAGGGTYTPDFLAWADGCSEILVVEVKGGYRGSGWEQGYERYKRCAAQYDGGSWRFVMLTWDAKRREWSAEYWR